MRGLGGIFNSGNLIFREQLGLYVIDTDLICDDAGGRGLVAGKHGQFLDAELMQTGQGTFRIRTGHVAKHDAGGQFAVDRHVCGHFVRRERGKQRADGFRLAGGCSLRGCDGHGWGYNRRPSLARHSTSRSKSVRFWRIGHVIRCIRHMQHRHESGFVGRRIRKTPHTHPVPVHFAGNTFT